MGKSGVISLGEVFVDMISLDKTNTKFQPFIGGATVNLAVGVKRQGIDSCYLCKLGRDETSVFVEEAFNHEGVCLDYAVHSDTKKSCEVYVHQTNNGDRVFHSYVNPTPDEWLTEQEVGKIPFQFGKIFYFGSGTLFHETACETTKKALLYAKEEQLFIGFDVNIRLKRWDSEEQCRKTICSFLSQAHLVKMAEEELLFLMDTESYETAISRINQFNIPSLFITKGSKGACAYHKDLEVCISGLDVDVVDTTGAGDAFMASLLCSFHEKGEPSSFSQLEKYLHDANKAGAIATTKMGSL
ncbi:carbohydrate kinase [Bacillus sp. S/N-304-OC-R1]|uniref:carbohydrate kinase family protein n=1 Tax=Bacillus sp. S/N-304-OC-R1 TaxID=2758034 RepID=UPI001C8E5AA8|nr:carbohydrate kinase [Bacillus sp. S/N-304-OC-R1]MBY0121519.1 carbohydrate kinase [Bacillus sp. S/N-304-OC-R1]